MQEVAVHLHADGKISRRGQQVAGVVIQSSAICDNPDRDGLRQNIANFFDVSKNLRVALNLASRQRGRGGRRETRDWS